MKRYFVLVIVNLLPMLVSADPIEINGIWYNLVTKVKQAEVTRKPNGEYIGDVNIPTSVVYNDIEYTVNSIGYGAFYGCINLNTVTIPNSVTSIGAFAFYHCSSGSFGSGGLQSVTIPDSVTSIGKSAFEGCSKLISFTIPYSLTTISERAFFGCSRITSAYIPENVTAIGERAFFGCSSLTSVTIPASVSSIGEGAFLGCSNLLSIDIADLEAWCNLNIIDPIFNSAHHLYLNGEEITDLVIPNPVSNLGFESFSYCCGLTSVTIPKSVTSIGEYAFSECISLTSISIPTSVTTISIGAFSGCSNLVYITIPMSVTTIETGVFSRCSHLISVTIPDSVTDIGMGAFSGCSGLTSINIPNRTAIIGNNAFANCINLASVIIGSNIKSIGGFAFAGCSELKDVYCYSEQVPQTINNVFDHSFIDYATLHVPAASIEQYKTTDPWCLFGTIVATDGNMPEPPTPQKCATPTISYANGELAFTCETEGVEFVSEITDTDIRKFYDAKVSLSVTYTINVFATKDGYDNSEVATATLCWIESDPKKEGVGEDKITELNALPVLIQTQDGNITIQGLEKGTKVYVYSTSGMLLDTSNVSQGTAILRTALTSGSTAIVKIGQKSVKVIVR